MNFINHLMNQIGEFERVKKIILIDGDDPRAQAAAKMLAETQRIQPLLLFEGPVQKVEGVESLNVLADEAKLADYAKKYFEFRKGKETLEQAQKAVRSRLFYAAMMLRYKEADGVIGGLVYPTADILRAAFKVIGPKPGIKTISSAMIMIKGDDLMIFSDISVNPNPNVEQLVDIGKNAFAFAKEMAATNIKLAFLSFSTKGSAVSEESTKVAKATELYNQTTTVKAVGEIQFDAAVDETIRKAKYKELGFPGKANVLIFPTLDAGNIGYKIAQRLGGYIAIGPILTGANGPINDLSRGATAEDVFFTGLITALQAK